MTVERTSKGHAALYMAPTIVQSLLPLLTLPIFTRVLSREEYGLWGLATALGTFVSSAASLGLLAGYERNYFASADAASRGSLLYSVGLFALAMQVAGFIAVAAAGPALSVRLMGSSDHTFLILLAYATAAFGSLKMFLLTTLRNEGQAREYVKYSVDELFLGTALSLAAVIWLRLGVTGLLVGPLTASGAVLAALAARSARRVAFAVDSTQLRDTLRVSLPLAPRILIGAAGNQLDRLVLGAVGSLANVGLYTIGQRMAQFVFAFMTALQNVYQPQVYRMLFARAPSHDIGRLLLPYGYVSAAIAVTAVIFSREMMWLVAAPEFAGAWPVLAILSVHYGLMFFGKQPQLMFAKRARIVSVLSLLTVGLNAGAVYLGARAGGPIGAATGMLLAGVCTGAIGLLVAQRFAPIGYPLAPFTLVFGALPMALALVLLLHKLNLPALLALAIKLLAFAAFAAAGIQSGLVGSVWRGRTFEPLPK